MSILKPEKVNISLRLTLAGLDKWNKKYYEYQDGT